MKFGSGVMILRSGGRVVKFKMSCNGSTEFDVVDIYVAEGEIDPWQPLLREEVSVGCDFGGVLGVLLVRVGILES